MTDSLSCSTTKPLLLPELFGDKEKKVEGKSNRALKRHIKNKQIAFSLSRYCDCRNVLDV